MSSVIDNLERAQLRRVPSFAPGDRVKVHFQVIEGTRRRVQVFEGVVIKRQGHGARETFTVRKQSFGVGVERMFPVHSPKIERIELASRGDVRRAKLYYLRDRVGKRARVRERRYTGPEETVQPGLLHETETPQAPEAEHASGAEGGASAEAAVATDTTAEKSESAAPESAAATAASAAEVTTAGESVETSAGGTTVRPGPSGQGAATPPPPALLEPIPPPMPAALTPAIKRRDASLHGGRSARAAMGVRSAKGSVKGAGAPGDSTATTGAKYGAAPAQGPPPPKKRAKSTTNSTHRARRDHRDRRPPRGLHPGVHRQALPDSQWLDGTDADQRPARARRPLGMDFGKPHIGEIAVFHPPKAQRTSSAGRSPARRSHSAAPPATDQHRRRPP